MKTIEVYQIDWNLKRQDNFQIIKGVKINGKK